MCGRTRRRTPGGRGCTGAKPKARRPQYRGEGTIEIPYPCSLAPAYFLIIDGFLRFNERKSGREGSSLTLPAHVFTGNRNSETPKRTS
jgi:hypothetical protein